MAGPLGGAVVAADGPAGPGAGPGARGSGRCSRSTTGPRTSRRSARPPSTRPRCCSAPTATELGKLDPSVVGEQVAVDELPDHVVDAVLAAEDRGFYDHGGFSVRGTLRAAWANLRSGDVEQGGSTITQQYVDLTTPGAGRTLRAKLDEAASATRLEDELGKDQILERYLNIVPFGRNATGIDQAARVYFHVPATELVRQPGGHPGRHDRRAVRLRPREQPRRGAGPARRRARRRWPPRAGSPTAAPTSSESGPLPDVADESLVQYGSAAYVVDAVRRQLVEELGQEGLGRGLVVHTTIDARMQELAQTTLREHVGSQPYTGAVVTVDPVLRRGPGAGRRGGLREGEVQRGGAGPPPGRVRLQALHAVGLRGGRLRPGPRWCSGPRPRSRSRWATRRSRSATTPTSPSAG